jgi:hypothetical protein
MDASRYRHDYGSEDSEEQTHGETD